MEACIIMPVIMLVMLFGLRLIQAYTAVNCLDRAVLKTGRLLADYGLLYHEYGLETLENRALEHIGANISERTGDSTGMQILSGFADLRACAQTGDNLLYSEAAGIVCRYFIGKDGIVKSGFIDLSDISFSGSRFFDAGDDIELYAKARFSGRIRIGTSVKVRAWIRGNDPLLSLNESGITVWQLGNFARGKIIRALFGGNLPYDYPVVCAVEKGEALMIKSLNTTSSSYSGGKKFEQELKSMIDRLSDFKGGNMDNIAEKGYRVFSPAEIRTRRLLLVIPEEGFNDFQAGSMQSIMAYAASKGVVLEPVAYQKALKTSGTDAGDDEAGKDQNGN